MSDYTKVHANWEDKPATTTPILAADLEHMEEGIDTAHSELQDHLDDSSAAHAAAAVSVADTAGNLSATNVEAALAEIHGTVVAGGGATELTDLDDVTGGAPQTGEAPVWDGDSFELTDVATQAELDAHINDTTAAHAATAIGSATAGNLSSTNVQAALQELDTEKAAAVHAHDGGDITSGTVADARIASTIARDSEVTTAVGAVTADLAAHLADTADAHDASAISIADAGNDFTATDVEGALDELQADAEADAAALAAHIGDTSDAHDASAISVDSSTLVGTGTDVQAVFEELDNAIADHLADTADAHDASAISVADSGGYLAASEVEAALAELAKKEWVVQIAVTDPNGDAITTGDGKAYLVIPDNLNGMNLVDADAAVTTASSSGTPTVQIRNVTQTADMLSTKITIDQDEKTSYTAAAAPAIDANNDDVATGDIIAVDIDVAGTGAKGLIVILTFQLP